MKCQMKYQKSSCYLYVYMLLFFFSCWDVSNSLQHQGLQPTHQSPLSMGFCTQEYWSGMPFPSSGDLPSQEATYIYVCIYIHMYTHIYVCMYVYIYIIKEVLEEKFTWDDGTTWNMYDRVFFFLVVLKESSSSVNSH